MSPQKTISKPSQSPIELPLVCVWIFNLPFRVNPAIDIRVGLFELLNSCTEDNTEPLRQYIRGIQDGANKLCCSPVVSPVADLIDRYWFNWKNPLHIDALATLVNFREEKRPEWVRPSPQEITFLLT